MDDHSIAIPGSTPGTPATASSNVPIQRTIEEEGQTQGNNSAQAQSQASSTVLYGLGAIILIIIAIGAVVMLMKES